MLLCIAFFAILYTYSKRDTISVAQRRIFSGLTTATALALGINLTASLKSYARMMRWRVLSLSYQPLTTFDTIMSCDSRLNNPKLLWRGREKGRALSTLQRYALLWLFVNILTVILVGMIGLTYNLDVSPDLVLTRNGTVSITDLSKILTDDYQAILNVVNAWGRRGTILEPIESYEPEDQVYGTYSSSFIGVARYYFGDVNEDETNDISSWRYVDSEARCEAYNVLEGGNGTNTFVVYGRNGKVANQTLGGAPPGAGGLAFVTPTNSVCGTRCNNMLAFQAGGPGTEDTDDPTSQLEARLFICNNTISMVDDLEFYVGPEYQFPNLQARILADAIGWSGDYSQNVEQYVAYPHSSAVSFNYTPTATNMSSLISGFSIGAIAAGDSPEAGIGREIVQHGEEPVDAQILHVTWKYCGAILALIPLLHFSTLMAAVVWANKAIVKDDSYLAIAKVYHSLLTQLGPHGCTLRGPEIAHELGQPMVMYGFLPAAAAGGIGHADCFEAGSGVLTRESFDEGLYDGSGYGKNFEPQRKEKLE